jgi:hypothetical protein
MRRSTRSGAGPAPRPGRLSRLAEADAFLPSLKLARREAAWAIKGLRDTALPLFDQPGAAELNEPPPRLKAMTEGREIVEDYSHVGLSLRRHPLALLRPDLEALGRVPAGRRRRRDGRLIKTAGLVLVRQMPGTAKGVMFMTIEDETGAANLVIWKTLYEKQRRIAGGPPDRRRRPHPARGRCRSPGGLPAPRPQRRHGPVAGSRGRQRRPVLGQTQPQLLLRSAMPDQPSLFDPPGAPAAPPAPLGGLPEGLIYREGLIDAAEEAALAEAIAALPFKPFQFHGYEGNRRVVSFGWAYDFAGQVLEPAEPIPNFLLPLRGKVAALAGRDPRTSARPWRSNMRRGPASAGIATGRSSRSWRGVALGQLPVPVSAQGRASAGSAPPCGPRRARPMC